MITLYSLIQSQLLCASDHLSFVYKAYSFSCQVDCLGVLYDFMSNGQRVFTDRVPFDSLSTWADCCIQEIAREYVTRFSSWKRVKHQESGLCLNILRQMHSQFAIEKPPITANSLHSIRQYLSVLSRYCGELEDCIQHWEQYQVGAEKRPPESMHCKPPCLEHILSVQERYASEKSRAEEHFKNKVVFGPLPIQTGSTLPKSEGLVSPQL